MHGRRDLRPCGDLLVRPYARNGEVAHGFRGDRDGFGDDEPASGCALGVVVNMGLVRAEIRLRGSVARQRGKHDAVSEVERSGAR